MNNDIETLFKHEYETKFIIDMDDKLSRLTELHLEKHDRVFFVVDKNVAKQYKSAIIDKAITKGQEYFVHHVEAVEESKSISYYPVLINFLAENNAGRYDAVVAVGGGIVIDLVSFSVSTYMRGLPLYIIATTLIGQTDASTAGKTCLNTGNAKNLLGTFYYPKVVYNNVNFLFTCKKRITRQGLSEAFKYSLLTDGILIPQIVKYDPLNRDKEATYEIVEKTIQSRITIRKIDPLASNLGHTYGHALEKYFDYQILHGDAISIGTVMAMHFAVKKGIMRGDEYKKIVQLMREANLNIYIEEGLDTKRLVGYMRKDKKSSSKNLHLVMIEEIARPYRGETPFYEAEYDDVEQDLTDFMNEYDYKTSDLVALLKKEDIYDN